MLQFQKFKRLMASYYSFGNIGNNSPVSKKNWLKEFHAGGHNPYPVGTYDQKKTKQSWWLNGTFKGVEYQINYKGNFKYEKNSDAAIGKWKIVNVYSKSKLQLKIKVGPPFVKYNHEGEVTNNLKESLKLANKQLNNICFLILKAGIIKSVLRNFKIIKRKFNQTKQMKKWMR